MHEIYKEILEYYGKDKQLLVVYEELSELIKAVTKHERGMTTNINNIVEETAHVIIIIEYLKLIYGFTDQDVQMEVNKKVKKLKNYRQLYPRY